MNSHSKNGKVFVFTNRQGSFLGAGVNIREALLELEARSSMSFTMGVPANQSDMEMCNPQFLDPR